MSERTKTIWTILGAVGLVWLFSNYFHHSDLMRERAKYSVGHVRGTHWAVKSGRQVNYLMMVNGQTYQGGDDEVPGMKIEGGRYLVRYDSLDPEWKAVYYKHPIPDSVGEAPANGWFTPPFPVPAEVTSRQTD